MSATQFTPLVPATHPLRLARLVWCVLALAVCVKALVSPVSHSVWPVLALGSEHWWTGQSLYIEYFPLDRWRYSPTFAVALTPLAALPLGLGGAVWGLVNVGVLYAGLRALQRHVLPHRFGPRGQAAFLILAAVGSASMLWNLQSNGLLLGLVALGLAATARQRWWTASFLLAVPVYLKVWPLAVVMLLLACRPRPLLGRYAVALAVLGVVPFLTAGPATVALTYDEWFACLSDGRSKRWPGYRDMWTLWELTVPPAHAGVYMLLQLGAAGAALLACLGCQYRRVSQRHLLTIVLGSWVCWQLLWGPGTEKNTFGLIAPLMAWGALAARKEQRGQWWIGAAVVLFLFMSIGGLERHLDSSLPWIQAGLPLSVLLYTVWFARSTWQRMRNGENVAANPTEQPALALR